MDRQTKLAYRQRGSRLRHFSSSSNGNGNGNSKNDDNDGNNEVSTDGTLVIKTPLRLNPGINSVTDFDVEPLAEEQPELKRQHVETEIETANQGEPGPELTEEEEEEEEYAVDDKDVSAHPLSWDYYKELQLDKSQLNSITVIKDLIDNLTNKFLLPRAKEQTSLGEIVSSNKDTNSLDTKVFELFNEGVSTDLKDIRDINEANNIILKQIDKKLRRVKTLNAELAYVRARYTDIVQNYTRAGDKQGQRSNNRLELDEQLLSKLTRRILLLSPSRSGLQSDNGLYAECDSSVEQLCELLNPTDGLVARLRDLQSILRSSEFLCHEEER